MRRKRKIPGDFAVIALSLEAQQRKTSYGKLYPRLSAEEREQIVEKWKKKIYG